MLLTSVILLDICMLFVNCLHHSPSTTPNVIEGIESVIRLNPDIKEDSRLSTPELIRKYGYMAEVHHVITEDGYILELHRIIGGPKSPPQRGKRVCLLQHGLLDSSATWVLTGPNHGLGYLLADRNYDVWLGNSRGNTYSRKHIKYNPFGSPEDREKFWSFSWHEIGIHDLPATINYILHQTDESKLQYVGHSQGSTAFFVLMSEKPEYNEKIVALHALGPVAYLAHVRSPSIRLLSPLIFVWNELISSWLGMYDFMPSTDLIKWLGDNLCQDKAITHIVCENIIFSLAGNISDQMNATLLPVIVGHAPAGSSTKQVVHYGQQVNSGRFCQFDYGSYRNLVHYHRISPPDYNLNNVKVPVALYYSRNDWLAAVEDVQHLIRKLPNIIHTYLVPHNEFNHIDFLWGINVTTLLYNDVFNVMHSTT